MTIKGPPATKMDGGFQGPPHGGPSGGLPSGSPSSLAAMPPTTFPGASGSADGRGPLPPLLPGLAFPPQGLMPGGGPPASFPPPLMGGPLGPPHASSLGPPGDEGGGVAGGPPPSWTLEGRGRAESGPRQGASLGGRNLYIHNVSKEAREADVKAFFSQCGEVESVALRVNQRVGPNAVYAFVLYKKPEDAKRCFETYNGKTFSEPQRNRRIIRG